MGEPVETKIGGSLRGQTREILLAVRVGGVAIAAILTVVAVAKQWWWMMGVGMALATLALVFAGLVLSVVEHEEKRFPEGAVMVGAYRSGIRTCTLELQGDGNSTMRILLNVELAHVEYLGSFLAFYMSREGGGTIKDVVLYLPLWRLKIDTEGVVLERIAPDTPDLEQMGSLSNLVSLRLTRATNVH